MNDPNIVDASNVDNHSFPAKLYSCLSEAEAGGFADAIAWQPDGLSFKVHHQAKFVDQVLPRYFGSIKFKSWQRQLNLYGFTRISKGLARGSYAHESFKRGHKAMSIEISRNGGSSHTGIPEDSSVNPSTKQPSVSFTLNLENVALQGTAANWQNDILMDRGRVGMSWSRPSSTVSAGESYDCLSLDLESDFEASPSNKSSVTRSLEALISSLSGNHSGTIDIQAMSLRPSYTGSGACSFPSQALPSAHDLVSDLAQTDQERRPVQRPSEAHAARQVALEQRNFPWKLHDMLSEAETGGYQHIVSWESDGRSFKVHDSQEFVARVMPLFFDQSRYESFRRQLRKYGFSRTDKDRYRGSYYHQMFQRQNRSLCKFITREASTSHGAK
eukprot:Nitzschia sp. Nitz4//scaffold10_size219509//21180//22548//NITZ4_001397-RA/size219509-snap-gene-0.358-mRNA-1//1//CDS//3329532827//5254//frame0